MRIHLGHHFYGAGNLGDDFMLAGFLAAMRTLAPQATYTACVPFPLGPLIQRFPEIEWRPYDDVSRSECIRAADSWLGLGGSPFQSAQSRWFIDHLLADAALCRANAKPMFYLGVGVQTATELTVPDVASLWSAATAIWTRDAASAERLQGVASHIPVCASADLAHVYFARQPPPPAATGRLALVANFDYGSWPGMESCLAAIDTLRPAQRVWLAQETRPLPGAEKALFADLPASERQKWQLIAPDVPGGPLTDIVASWPSAEHLVSSRYHAAIAGSWAGSKIVLIATNEKLRGLASELGFAAIDATAEQHAVQHALLSALPAQPPYRLAEAAFAACREFVQAFPKS